MTDLDAAMRAAHREGDAAALIGLCQAAALVQAEAFWLTQAWIHALDAGDDRATALQRRLTALGAQ